LPRSRRPRCSERATLLLAALLCLVAAGGVAHADDDAVEAYRQAVERGAELFEQQDYTGARAAFESAYTIHAEPTLVFNIASTYRREGNLEEAVVAYRRYLSLSAGGGDDARRQLARETIEALDDTLARRAASERAEREQAQQAAERERKVQADREAEARREREDRAARAAAARADDGPLPAAPPSLSFEPAPEPSPWKPRLRTAGTVFGVAGGLALGYATVSAVRAREAESTLNGATTWNEGEAQLYRDGSAARRRAVIAGGVGLGLTGAAVALYLLGREPSGEQQPDLGISPAIQPGGAGAVVYGSF
jgi:tetratricopeptide (TPR) repeat protein